MFEVFRHVHAETGLIESVLDKLIVANWVRYWLFSFYESLSLDTTISQLNSFRILIIFKANFDILSLKSVKRGVSLEVQNIHSACSRTGR